MKKILRIGLSAAALLRLRRGCRPAARADRFAQRLCPAGALLSGLRPAGRLDRGRRVPAGRKAARGTRGRGAVARHDLRGALRGACRDAFQTERRTRLEGFGPASATDGRTQVRDRSDAARRRRGAGALARGVRSRGESRRRARHRDGTGSRACGFRRLPGLHPFRRSLGRGVHARAAGARSPDKRRFQTVLPMERQGLRLTSPPSARSSNGSSTRPMRGTSPCASGELPRG